MPPKCCSSRGRGLLRESRTSSIVTMPTRCPLVDDRQGGAVLLPEHADRRLLIVRRAERDVTAVHDVR